MVHGAKLWTHRLASDITIVMVSHLTKMAIVDVTLMVPAVCNRFLKQGLEYGLLISIHCKSTDLVVYILIILVILILIIHVLKTNFQKCF